MQQNIKFYQQILVQNDRNLFQNFIYVPDLGADKIWRYVASSHPETKQPVVEKSGSAFG
jgi:hypothetical protein